MKKISFTQSLKDNAVALISLTVAIIALGYTAWREERTEKNRTLRVAAFEILKDLGDLQGVVNASHYQKDKKDPIMGWGYIALIGDLSELLPAPIPETTGRLTEVWGNEWNSLDKDPEAVERVSKEIDASRLAIRNLLRSIKEG